VALAAGIDHVADIGELDFTFVVMEGAVQKLAVEHRWDIRGGRARIRWTDREGRRFDAVLDVGRREATGTIDGRPASGADAALLSERSYARWINDTYWLLLPVKLFDPGARLDLEPDHVIEDQPHHVLRLSFDGVGLTPKDVYWLFVNPEAQRIVRWEMLLEGESERRGVTFTDYRPVGPLVLAHDHAFEGTDRRVVIEGVRATKSVDPMTFSITE
jgi:hypothetical protein